MTLIVTTFLALLTVLAAFGVVVLTALAALGILPPVRSALGPAALWLAFAVALTANVGSLYLSEVAGFVPCTLCWYQRTAMYPLVVVLALPPGVATTASAVGVVRARGLDPADAHR